MANDLNVVGLVGRLTRPCDMRYTNSGFAICSFSLAVNKRKKQTDGSWKDQASFFDCTFFGKAAQGVSQYLQKGQQVAIQGSLEQQSWDDKATGQKRSKIAVIVDSIQLIGGSQTNSNSSYTPPARPAQNNQSPAQSKTHQSTQADTKTDDFDDENIPF